MAKCHFVITLVKEGDEDEYLKETWNSIVFLRNSYISHSKKLKSKRALKRKKNLTTKSAPVLPPQNSSAEKTSANSSNVQGSNPTPTNEKAADITLVSVTPVSAPVAPQSNIGVQHVPVVATTTTSTTSKSTKSWVQVVTPPKPSPLPEKDQEKEAHPQPHRAVSTVIEDRQDTSKKEKKEKKEKKRKTPSSSSSSDSPSPKKTTKSGKAAESSNVAKYQKWIRDWVRAGLNLKAIKGQPNLEWYNKKGWYVVWEGRTRGIFEDWASCSASVDGYKGSKYKKVTGSPIDALNYLKSNLKSIPDVLE